ncbi:magnesium and cobalt transport protein CorA [Microbacterium immunditiarum]|uniref:Magnesium transporter n=1 Tax=Microbacterium immunditiarum TaxID=337480 RepID=A0A7Y9GNI7_9MICO|nr:magnesium and cobalt transport protein CorA [Microbacterium immunditiarum]NYE19788.1 magnesium transporter [Microbacterium immunditiarum]
MTVVDVRIFSDGEQVGRGMSPADAAREASVRSGFAWIALQEPTAEQLDELMGLLKLHPLAVRDCLRDHQRAKLSDYGEDLFLVMQAATYHDDTETVELAEVDVFAGVGYVVTVARGQDLLDLDDLARRIAEHRDAVSRGSHSVVWALFERILSEYGPVLDGVENDIDEIEDELFADDVGVSRRIFALQREVIDLQHATAPLADIFDRLTDAEKARTGRADAPALRNLGEQARHVADRVDGFRQTLGTALDVHATLVEQRNNEVMRRMTEFNLEQNDQVKKVSSWAAILFAPTLVGTVYGMNFDAMPELAWPWGYPFALGLMLATSLTLYIIFKRRNWL